MPQNSRFPSGPAALSRQRGDVATLVANFPPEDHAAVSVAAATAVLERATGEKKGSAPPWHPGDEYAS